MGVKRVEGWLWDVRWVEVKGGRRCINRGEVSGERGKLVSEW